MILSRDKVFFNTAKEVSKLSDFKRVHIGCVATYKNRIISSGCNSNKTNPLQCKYNKVRFTCDGAVHSCHAETATILPLLKDKELDRSRVHLYLYREYANGHLAPSRPCPSCMKMLTDAGFQHVYYTTENGYAEEYIMEK